MTTELPTEQNVPHNIEAEQSVLGAVLISPGTLDDLAETLRAEDFYRPSHQIIYSTFGEMHAIGVPVDPITTLDHLSKRGELARVGGGGYLHTLISGVPTATNVGHYARIVREEAIRRRVKEAGARLDILGSSGEDVSAIMDRVAAELDGLAEARAKTDYLRIGEIMPEALDAIEGYGSKISGTVLTGFADLDALTNGLHPHQFIVVGARPAIGKALALDTPLPTPTGWTTMGRVQVGGQLIGADGRPTRVIAATGVMHGRPCYEVEFSDGTVIVADAHHQWRTKRAPAAHESVVTTEEIARTLRADDGRPAHAIVAAGPRGLLVRTVTDVRPVPTVPVRCVEVDNADHMYLAGRTGIPTHNSTLGLDLARNVAKAGETAVVFSLEMSRLDIVTRLLSAEARVSLHKIRAGRMDDEDWGRVARRLGEITDIPLYVDDSPRLSMMEIWAKCRRLKQERGLRFAVVDYLQLMKAGGGRSDRQQEISEISRGLKLMAKELDITVLAMSQLNRGPEQRTDKRPMVSDLRESGSIEQDADLVILIHREDAYDKESPRAGEADLIVAKHRNGPTATISVAFQGHYSRFVDMAPS